MPTRPQTLQHLIAALALGCAIVFVFSLVASEAEAKPKIGLELNLGATAPLPFLFGPYVSESVVLLEEERNGAVDFYPYIGDVQNEAGGTFTLLLTLRSLEFSIATFNFPFVGTELQYRGNSPARRVSEFHVDDAAVNYLPLDPTRTVDEVQLTAEDLRIWTLNASYRYYLVESRFWKIYVPIGGGLVFASGLVPSLFGFVGGAHAQSGGAIDFQIEGLALTLNARYHFILTPNVIGTQEAAGHAVVTGSNVIDTFTSSMHFVTVNLGLRFPLQPLLDFLF